MYQVNNNYYIHTTHMPEDISLFHPLTDKLHSDRDTSSCPGVLAVKWCGNLAPTQFYSLTQDKYQWTNILNILEDMKEPRLKENKLRFSLLKAMPPNEMSRNFKEDLAEHYFGLDINY